MSIIKAAYNSESTILESYHSVLNQTYENWAWIVVNDSSTDSTKEILATINDTRIFAVTLVQNVGVRAASNTLLDLGRKPSYNSII